MATEQTVSQRADRVAAKANARQELEAKADQRQFRDALLQEVAQWRQAVQLREYIQAVMNVRPSSQQSDMARMQWGSKAVDVLDEIDPLPKRLQLLGLLKLEPREDV